MNESELGNMNRYSSIMQYNQNGIWLNMTNPKNAQRRSELLYLLEKEERGEQVF